MDTGMMLACDALDEAFGMIDAAGGETMFFLGPVPESDVARAEATLGLRLSPSYRAFLLKYGQGFVGAYEILGLIPNDPHPGQGHDFLAGTVNARRFGLPPNMVLFHNLGDGEDYVLDLSSGIEPQVRQWCSGADWDLSQMYFAEVSFPEFLLDRVRLALDEAENQA